MVNLKRELLKSKVSWKWFKNPLVISINFFENVRMSFDKGQMVHKGGLTI
jgi:hypothetical protein